MTHVVFDLVLVTESREEEEDGCVSGGVVDDSGRVGDPLVVASCCLGVDEVVAGADGSNKFQAGGEGGEEWFVDSSEGLMGY